MTIRPRPQLAHLYIVVPDAVSLRILPQVVGFTLYSMIIVLVARQYHLNLSELIITPLVLVGAALSIYLLLRNNAAYQRWWEARKLASTLVSEIRNLARATITFIPERPEQRALLMEALAFCHCLRGQLRNTNGTSDAAAFIDMEAHMAAKFPNPADEMLRRMRSRADSHRRSGAVDAIGFRILDDRLTSMSAIQTNCERIAGAPLPFADALFVHSIGCMVCLLLPIGLMPTTGWATPLFTAMIAYTIFGLDALCVGLEHPFDSVPNDRGLDVLCNVFEISVFDALGETPLKIIPAETT